MNGVHAHILRPHASLSAHPAVRPRRKPPYRMSRTYRLAIHAVANLQATLQLLPHYNLSRWSGRRAALPATQPRFLDATEQRLART